MIKKYFKMVMPAAAIILALTALPGGELNAQVQGSQQQTIKWLSVGALRQWFSNAGAEIEYGRRGRASFVNVDQLDGLIWPSEYVINKGVNVGKSLWIGTTNFQDPVSGRTYANKVVCSGRLNINLGTEIIADELKMYGKAEHPVVRVDNVMSSAREFDDEVDAVQADMQADRMIVNRFHTSIGITVTRKIYAFSQQYNDNYFITEYVFKNTGIIDPSGQKKLDKTLTGVVFHWQYRYGFAGESYLPSNAWAPTGASWGLNTINDCVGQDAKHKDTKDPSLRAVWSYYGPVSTSPGASDDIGLPRYTNGSILAGTNFSGVAVLHADKSAKDHSDDPAQPSTTMFMPSDRGAQGDDQYDPALMTRKYNEFMTGGHPAQTHAEQVGKDPVTGWPTGFANTWGGDAGGYAAAQGYGPYDMAPGDSVRIVVAEAVAGIMKDRTLVREIAKKWYENAGGPYILPDKSTTTDRNRYKNTWVFSGKDSLFQAFYRAKDNFSKNFVIPQAPPPPSQFNVNSGGNRISLSWADNAASWPNFNGYRIYRSEGRTDTTYDLIFECDKAGAVTSFDDKTARRGFNYYYYIQTKDNGSTNTVQPGVPMVSSRYLTMTTRPAFLTRPPGTNMADIRIVPNPFNIKARDQQFGQNYPDKLAFFGLPPACKIRIYTENGDLVYTIDHNNGSGDESWYSVTSSNQIVVSGLYIAHFEVTQDAYDDVSGQLLFKKGDTTFKKFIIIR